jgi:hypothetical protein
VAKKPEKREARRVKYRVRKKAFVGGSLHEPGAIVEAEEGLDGDALDLIDEPKAPPVAGNDTQTGGNGQQ